MWECEIAKVDNGYVLKYWEETESQNIRHRIVFEEQDTETGELEVMKNLLRAVTEHFGIIYSKHNKNNLEIRITGMEEDGETND